MMRRPTPIHELPGGYREVYYWGLEGRRQLINLNIAVLAPLLLAAALMLGWVGIVEQIRAADGVALGENFPRWAGLLLLVAVFPLHEGLHGLAIRWMGHRARYGIKPEKLALYATADNALFTRNQFIAIALAPLAGITFLGMLLLVFSGAGLQLWLGLAVAFNAGSAIGDLWMVWIVLRYDAHALVRDEEDGIRIYTQAVGRYES